MESRYENTASDLINYFNELGESIFNDTKIDVDFLLEFAEKLIENVSQNIENENKAPNIFTVNISNSYFPQISNKKSILNKICKKLMYLGENIGLQFNGPLVINIFPNKNISDKNYIINVPNHISSDLDLINGSRLSNSILYSPPSPKAFLIIGGESIIPLNNKTTTIGRKLDNVLILNNPKVSRHHGKIIFIKGRNILVDLNSAGGITVNGNRIGKKILRPGDVISISGEIMVYGQDSDDEINGSLEYKSQNTSIPIPTLLTIKQRINDK